jgi:hypothetical protein
VIKKDCLIWQYVQLRAFCYSAVCNTAAGYLRLSTDILREINGDRIVGYECIKINATKITKKQLEVSTVSVKSSTTGSYSSYTI